MLQLNFPNSKKKSILKSATEKGLVTYKGAFIAVSVDFLQKPCRPEKKWYKVFRELKEKLLTKNTTAGKTVLYK